MGQNLNTLRSIPTEIAFSENEAIPASINTSKADAPYVQIMRVGKFNHSVYGEFEISQDTLRQLKDNFDKKIRGIDIAVDYFHESDKHAAGWFTELFLSDDHNQLWGKVKWTPAARTKLAEKEIRYFSADFTTEYIDPETGEKFANVLLGGGLTNRPFIKGMEPIVQLQEKNKGDSSMTLDEIKKENEQLKLDLSAAKKLADMMPSKEEKIKALEAEIAAKMKELDALKADNVAMKDEQKKYADEKALSEKTGAFEKLLVAGKVCAAQKEAFISGDTVKFAELAQPLNLADRGNGTGDTKNADAYTQIIKLAQEKIKLDAKLSLGDAISMVLTENKVLADEYNK